MTGTEFALVVVLLGYVITIAALWRHERAKS